MIISFSNYTRTEYFNGKEYPLGTTFTNIYNQMSTLINNNNFVLESYKDYNFYNFQKETLKYSKLKNLLNILNIQYDENYIPNSLKTESITIENVELNFQEFIDLTLFILKLDEFFRIVLKDTKLNKLEKFSFFFTVLNNYSMPNLIIEDEILLKKYEKIVKDFYNENKNINDINKQYDSILICDKKILKEIGKSENIISKYECKDFIQVLLVSYKYILEKEINLKQCRYCERFFIALNGNQEFCDNIRPQEINEDFQKYSGSKMSCRDFNKRVLSNKNTEPVKKAIRSVRLRIQKRIRNGLDTKEYLEEWEKSIKSHRSTYTHNDRYIEWILNESDIHQIRRKKNGSSRANKK